MADYCEGLEFGPIAFASNHPAFVRDSIGLVEDHGPEGMFRFVKRPDGYYLIIREPCRFWDNGRCVRSSMYNLCKE